MKDQNCAVRGLLQSRMLALAVLVFAGMAAATGASASLLDGKTVSFTYLTPTINTVYVPSASNGNYVVSATVEIPNGICCGFEGSVDLSDANILVNFHPTAPFPYTAAPFNGFRVSDVNNTIDDFTSVGVTGLTASLVTFDANNIWVNWQGISFGNGDSVSIDINGGSGNSVPEPSSIALVAMALLAAGSRFRKLRRSHY